MAQRSPVPKFGNWDNEENVPYTAYFNKARQGRNAAKMINPNDPEENPDMFSDSSSSVQGPTSRFRAERGEPVEQVAGRSRHQQQRSREDGDLWQFTDSPATHENFGASSESPHHRPVGRGVNSGETRRKPARPNGGTEHGVERSPLHRHARVSTRDGGVSSHSLDGKTSHDSSHGTPGRHRMKPETRGDETPEKGAAVPKFGDWDVNDPKSAEGYTHIFEQVRDQKNARDGRVPGNETPYRTVRKQDAEGKVKKACCIPWLGI